MQEILPRLIAQEQDQVLFKGITEDQVSVVPQVLLVQDPVVEVLQQWESMVHRLLQVLQQQARVEQDYQIQYQVEQ